MSQNVITHRAPALLDATRSGSPYQGGKAINVTNSRYLPFFSIYLFTPLYKIIFPTASHFSTRPAARRPFLDFSPSIGCRAPAPSIISAASRFLISSPHTDSFLVPLPQPTPCPLSSSDPPRPGDPAAWLNCFNFCVDYF